MGNQVPFIKIIHKTSSKIDQAKVVIKVFCVLSSIKLSDTEVTTLAYFIVYGFTDKTKDLIIKSKLLTFSSLKNTLTKYRRVGLINKKTDLDDELNSKLNFTPSSTIGMFIKIDNS